MTAWEDKVWGRTRCLFESRKYSRHELELVAGGYCSFHYHNHRANFFKVEKGIVRVVQLLGLELLAEDLYEGAELQVPSRVPHQFQVIEDGVMLEEYFPDRGGDIDNSDIVRMSHGSNGLVFSTIDAPDIYDRDGQVLVSGFGL
jgi:mannose-6-phosphate isomerase-like protein (cupin superfamily)